MSLIMKNVKEENPMTSWQGTFMSANISSLMTRAVKRRRVCFFYIQKEHVPPEDKTSCPKNHYATDQAVLTEVTSVITLFGNAWLDDGTLKNHLQLFRERLSYKRWNWAYATMSKVIMGNGGFYGCLIELQGVSAWRKETAQTRVFLLSRSLLLNHLEPQSSQIKLLLPIMPIDIVAYAFRLLWDNLCRNNCKALCEISSRLTDWFKTTGAWCNGLSSRYQQSQ